MREISNVQVLRGLAALAVVAFHAQQELTWHQAPLPLPSLLAGAAGVDVFFVISGFIILYASADLFGLPGSVAPFAWRRLARIAPLYWMMSILTAIYTWKFRLVPLDLHAIERWLAASLFFHPGEANAPLLTTGWTLNYEVFFYLLFAPTLVLPRRPAVALLAAALCAYGAAGVLDSLPRGTSALATSLLFEFVGGLLIAEARLSGVRLPRWAVASLIAGGVGAIIGASAVDREVWWTWRGLVWGLPSTAIVAGASLAAEVRAGLLHRVLMRLGDASFSTYIVHYTLFSMLTRWMLPLFPGGPIGAASYFLALVLAAAIAGSLLSRAVERPLYRAMTRRRVRPSAPSSRPLAAIRGRAARREGPDRLLDIMSE